jgi:hypothetical protein
MNRRWRARAASRAAFRLVATNDDDDIARPTARWRSVSGQGVVAGQDFDDHGIDGYHSS